MTNTDLTPKETAVEKVKPMQSFHKAHQAYHSAALQFAAAPDEMPDDESDSLRDAMLEAQDELFLCPAKNSTWAILQKVKLIREELLEDVQDSLAPASRAPIWIAAIEADIAALSRP